MEPLNILLFDTSSNYLKIAISINNKEFFLDHKESFKHVEHLLPEIDKSFKKINADKNDLKFIGVCTGPGSFTGIRIGIATSLGIAYGKGIPCFGYSVFDIYNYILNDNDDSIIVPIIDAKKNRFYCSFIEKNKTYTMYDIDILEINQKLRDITKKIIFAGKDFHLIKDKIKINNFDYINEDNYLSKNILMYGIDLIKSGKQLSQPEPIYLRKSEAEIMLLKSQSAI